MNARVHVRFARKPSSLQEMMAEINSPACETASCEVAETVTLTAEEYDTFTRLLYKDWDWLDGRGGDRNGVCQVVAVTAPARETLYVNPEGYSYARFIGTALPADTATKYPHVKVKLVGEDSNAFNILGLCQRVARRANVPAKEISAFMQEATAGDYDHLLQTCQRWFHCY